MVLKITPGRLYTMALKMHKNGEGFYAKGNFELAKACHEEAEELREKARQMQNGMV